jgi:hypothetical protein
MTNLVVRVFRSSVTVTPDRFCRDLFCLTVLISLLLEHHQFFLVSVGGQTHLPLTLAFIGMTLGFAATVVTLSGYCPIQRLELRRRAVLDVHPLFTVSWDLRVGPEAARRIQQNFDRTQDRQRMSREVFIVVTVVTLVASLLWKVNINKSPLSTSS